LHWGVNKSLAEIVRKPKNSNEIAYAKAKAHFDLKRSVVIKSQTLPNQRDEVLTPKWQM
jgi:hypothetical protein